MQLGTNWTVPPVDTHWVTFSGVPAWQANFIPKMQAYVLANPSIAAVLYWNNRGFYGCQFAITGHPLSLTAMAAMGRAINGHLG